MTKTNVMRLLEQAKIEYTALEYEFDENDLGGEHAADFLGLPYEQVFKTLVTRGSKGGIYVFCIPVDMELDLKKAAVCAGEKKIEMIHVKELLGLTGYIRGGCSPIGMKKKYPTFIDETATLFDIISVSGGQRGIQIRLSPFELAEYIEAQFCDIGH
ncbi:MAG: Cys-tRNA(Pro) deacylase [Oscillospiraceae bacterium]|nr:Cys-tRNA(Pro) deacylase [Oscillospiraceae bacterium]